MKTRTLSILWSIAGLIGIAIGIRGYVFYSQGGFFIFMMPHDLYVKDIVIGLISLWIGIGLWLNPARQVKLVFSVPIWIMMFILINSIIPLFFKDLEVGYFLTVDYAYFFLSYYSLRELDTDIIKGNNSLKKYFLANSLFICVGGIVITGLIFILAYQLPYYYFSH